MNEFLVSCFYIFKPILSSEIADVRESILQNSSELGILGLFILSTEGCNATFTGSEESVKQLKNILLQILNTEKIEFKDSYSVVPAFRELKVKVRDEIVTLHRPDLVPDCSDETHLSPDEWNRVIKTENPLVIDTRNTYETEIGKFKTAVDPNIKEFTEFPEYLKQNVPDKDQKILIYCTGGIRCERAILDMKEQGYKEVYQLKGGILNYLDKFPNDEFDGECFVFDQRIAVDQNLRPTEKYRLCAHCGDPSKDIKQCKQCGVEAHVCQKCSEKGDRYQTCSKNCAHHFAMGHKTTRLHKESFAKRGAPLPQSLSVQIK